MKRELLIRVRSRWFAAKRSFTVGLIDVLEGNYGGDISEMPYVVNKEAFQR